MGDSREGEGGASGGSDNIWGGNFGVEWGDLGGQMGIETYRFAFADN